MASSFNELAELGSHGDYAYAMGFWPMQEAAANTTIADISSNALNATLGGGDDTEDLDVTGPNSWLPSGLNITGYPDTITFNSSIVPPTVKMFSGWFKWPSTARYLFGWNSGLNARPNLHVASSTSFLLYMAASNFRYFSVPTMSVDTWYHVAVYIPGTAQSDITGAKLYLNGTLATNGSTISSIAVDTINHSKIGGAYFSDPTGVAGVLNASTELNSTEVNQLVDGPEPVNSVAPAVTGTETNGATLSCTTGTWGLDSPFSSGSNGTIVYSYQWTRSTDGTGTGETDIVGATSATYVPIAIDIGKYLRCRVRASNTGGFDSAADTNSNFTGVITAVSPQIGIPGTANISSDGEYVWNDESNLLNDGVSFAETDTAASGDDLTDTLLLTLFGLAIPSGATFDGLEIILADLYCVGGVNASNNVEKVRPIIGGTQTGTDLGDNYQLAGSAEDKTYGSPTEKWGLGALTNTQLNASDTGIAIQFNLNNGDSIRLGTVRYKVYYTVGGSSEIEESASNTLSLTDETVAFTEHTQDLEDTLSLTDETVVSTEHTQDLEDTLSLTDETVVSTEHTQDLEDTLSLTDETVAFTETSEDVSDTLVITDQLLVNVEHTQDLEDTLSLSQDVSAFFDIEVSIVDTLSLTDELINNLIYTQDVIDTLTLEQIVNTNLIYTIALEDTLILTDIAINVTETIIVTADKVWTNLSEENNSWKPLTVEPKSDTNSWKPSTLSNPPSVWRPN